MKRYWNVLGPRDARGQASVELTAIMPLISLLIVGLLTVVRLAYTHLALITMTNDCVTIAAQRPALAVGAGNDEAALAAVHQDKAAFGVSPSTGLSAGLGGDAICQTFEYLPDSSPVHYVFRLPMQTYMSDWTVDP